MQFFHCGLQIMENIPNYGCNCMQKRKKYMYMSLSMDVSFGPRPGKSCIQLVKVVVMTGLSGHVSMSV